MSTIYLDVLYNHELLYNEIFYQLFCYMISIFFLKGKNKQIAKDAITMHKKIIPNLNGGGYRKLISPIVKIKERKFSIQLKLRVIDHKNKAQFNFLVCLPGTQQYMSIL